MEAGTLTTVLCGVGLVVMWLVLYINNERDEKKLGEDD